jgi:DNA-binding transcriptional LysR family regulator
MEMRQLRYFLTVAEELSFTRAATRLRIAQPAVSQQIRQLERELRQELFDRSERRVRLTIAGETFLSHARAALDAAHAGLDAVRSLEGHLTGELSIGAIPAPPPWLRDQLGRFRARHPNVRLIARTGDPESLTEAVTSGSLDLAIVGVTGLRRPAGHRGRMFSAALASWPVHQEPLVVISAPDDPLVARGEVSLRRLATVPLVTLLPGSGLRAVLEAAFAAAGVAPDIVVEAERLHVLPDLVAAGLGVAVVPGALVAPARHDLAVLRLVRPAMRRSTELIWPRTGASVVTRAFLDSAGARDRPHGDPIGT